MALSRGRLAVIAIAAVLLVGAVAAVSLGVLPSGDSGDDGVAAEAGELGVNETALWEQTQADMGQNVHTAPPIEIRGIDTDDDVFSPLEGVLEEQLIFEDPEEPSLPSINAYVPSGGDVVIVNQTWLEQRRAAGDTAEIRRTLVHEYVHVIQYQRLSPDDFGNLDSTDDAKLVRIALFEGGATYVEGQAVDGGGQTEIAADWRDASTSAAWRYYRWPYYRGLQYFQDRADSPADVLEVMQSAPPSTAAVLRGESDSATIPERDVTVDAGEYTSSFYQTRPGAIVVEVALTRAVPPERARDVAAGWRWGGYWSFRDGNYSQDPTRHVWLTEWQDPAAADAFVTAMGTYADDRWTAHGGVWRLDDGRAFDVRRIDDRSVAVVIGPDPFLAAISTSATADGYQVEAGNASSTAGAAPSGSAPTASVGA